MTSGKVVHTARWTRTALAEIPDSTAEPDAQAGYAEEAAAAPDEAFLVGAVVVSRDVFT